MRVDDLQADEHGIPRCPKCGESSGDTWAQCGEKCPMDLSPCFDQATSDRYVRTAIDDIAEHLLGTCKSLHEEWKGGSFQGIVDLDPSYFDEQVMLCETCEWWCEPHELNDNQECEGCHSGEGD